MMMAVTELLREYPGASDDQIRVSLAGNLCRCTGYQGILRAVQRLRSQPVGDDAATQGTSN
jgi:aerobic-type carbon monoxide dehydrogenase small subunit (CoxS/CutS family)